MTPEQFHQLERGDIVRNHRQSRAWLVAANNGDHVALVDYRHASNPDEWELVLKAAHVEPGRCTELFPHVHPEGRPHQCDYPSGHHGPHHWTPAP
jgi:hypothetical protein